MGLFHMYSSPRINPGTLLMIKCNIHYSGGTSIIWFVGFNIILLADCCLAGDLN